MQATYRVSTARLRAYLDEGDFAAAKSLITAYQGEQLVKTERVNGVFLHMDFQGGPELDPAFVEHMDSTDFEGDVPYERIVDIYDAMKKAADAGDHRMEYLHWALTWLAFWHRDGMTKAVFAERKGVTERTITNWVKSALEHLQGELAGVVRKGTGPIVLPPGYVPAPAPLSA